MPFLGLVVWGMLCVTDNLWYDEGYTAALISRPLKELIEITAQDVHAPFYYILLKGFYMLWGGGTHFWSLKLFSLFFMEAYLFLGKYGVKKLFDEETAVYFMLFSLLMPSMCVQAGNARMYAMGLFFFTAAGLLACGILQKSTGKKWVCFCMCSIGSVYSHTFTMIQTFILYLILLGALLWQKKTALLKWYLGSGLAVAACYMAWLTVIYGQMQSRISSAGANEALFIPNMYTLMDYCKEWFSAMDTPITLAIYLGMGLTLFLGYYAVDGMRSGKSYIPAWGMGILGLTALTAVLLCDTLLSGPLYLPGIRGAGSVVRGGNAADCILQDQDGGAADFSDMLCHAVSRRITAGV